MWDLVINVARYIEKITVQDGIKTLYRLVQTSKETWNIYRPWY